MNEQLHAAMIAFAQAKIEVAKADRAKIKARDEVTLADNSYYLRRGEYDTAERTLIALSIGSDKK